MMPQPSIDICMIVKNEEDVLKLTLGNSISCADKVIVVDTGSTDGTRKYCVDMGASVYDFKWVSDFSAARNFSISKSEANWILWLDADEYIEKEDFQRLREYLKDSSADVVYITINECEYGTKDKTTSYKRDKVFRNSGKIRFIRPVNEQLVREDGDIKKAHFHDFQIYHWGAHLPKEKQVDKALSRIEEFKGLLKSHKDPYIAFLIAGLLVTVGKRGEAIEQLDKILEMTSPKEEKDRSIRHAVYVKKGRIYEDNREYGLAISAADLAILTDSLYIEPYIIKSSSLMAQKYYAEAIETLEQAVNLKKKHHPVLGEADFLWDVKLYQNIANSSLFTEDFRKAEIYFKKMLESWDDEKIRSIISKLELLKNVSR